MSHEKGLPTSFWVEVNLMVCLIVGSQKEVVRDRMFLKYREKKPIDESFISVWLYQFS